MFKGCIEIENVDGGIRPLRFTQPQLKVYEDDSIALALRSRCSSGVAIDIETDSPYIAFEYSVEGWSREWLYFDVYINNVFVHTMGYSNMEERDNSFYYEIPKEHESNRVTIYLPHLVDIILYDIRVADGASVKEVPSYERDLLCLGDSITQGMDARHPSSAYPTVIARAIEANVLNQGVGGDVFNVNNLDPKLPFDPDIITVAYGTNDWSRYESIGEFRSKCKDYIDTLIYIYGSSQIFVITPIWRADIDEPKPMGEMSLLRDSMYEICSDYSQIEMIDGRSLVPNMPHYFGDQTVHPSDEGFLHMAVNLLPYITHEEGVM